jgi:transaldolase
MNTTSPLAALSAAGVSIWLDDLSRERITSGALKELIDNRNVVGVTTNPTIFAGALAKGDAYDAQVAELAGEGKTVTEAVFEITTHDVATGCDILRPVYDATTAWTAGYPSRSSRASLTTPPARLPRVASCGAKVDRPNVMIKVPATVEGLEAITALTADGASAST